MRAPLSSLVVPALLLSLAPSGCVPKNRYEKAVADANASRSEAEACFAERTRLSGEVARLGEVVQALEKAARERDESLAGSGIREHDLQVKLDDAIAQNEQLRLALERLGKNADALLAEKGTLASALAETKKRLDELRKAQAAADARAALFRDLALRFQKMIDAGQLKVVLRNGRMVLELPNDVLFDSGQTLVKKEGQVALTRVAAVLKTLTGRRFQVAGNTDDVPTQRSSFPTNWELSAARAVDVVRFLVKQGVPPGALSAAGYGEFDAVASNATPEGKARNRRIEITLQPNVEELVSVPGQ